MPGAPHRDPDGRRFAPGVLTGGRGGHGGQSTRSALGRRHRRRVHSRRTRAVVRPRPRDPPDPPADIGTNGSIVSVAPAADLVIRHSPAYRPSSRKVPIDAPLPGGSGIDRPAGMIRDRSPWPRRTLSYSGRKRGGAGTSGSGRGASGRSNNSRPRSSRNVASSGRRRSTTGPSPVRPDHARMSCTVAGPNAPR